MNDAVDSLDIAARWIAEGRRTALATVVSTWGSAPRAVGSRMVVDGDGTFEGSVSGGCIEAEVLATAEDVLADGRPVLRAFRVSDDRAAAAGLACGGTIEIFVERFDDAAFVDRIRRTVAEGAACTTVLDLATGARRFVDAAASDAATSAGEGARFVEHWSPRLRLVIVGAVHVAQTLAPIATRLGYAVTVVDPREAFAAPERFPDVVLDARWPDEFFAAHPPTARTAVVALTHVPRLDDPAIAAALAGPAFYVGALGSRATAEGRRERLRAAGVREADLARIHGPIGLDIGAAGPAEIAVAILAEITAELRLGGRRDHRRAA
jgi:xanthine dehydrogenase accessory factor